MNTLVYPDTTGNYFEARATMIDDVDSAALYIIGNDSHIAEGLKLGRSAQMSVQEAMRIGDQLVEEAAHRYDLDASDIVAAMVVQEAIQAALDLLAQKSTTRHRVAGHFSAPPDRGAWLQRMRRNPNAN